MNEYVIASDSEWGYWSNNQGWVYDVASATKFTKDETREGVMFVGVKDARYVAVTDAKDYDPYDERNPT